jgi:iron complex outermembrane receptor protein
MLIKTRRRKMMKLTSDIFRKELNMGAVAIAAVIMAPLVQAELVLEEITVTAQKMENNLQETPLAVTAVTGDILREQGTISVGELLSNIPGATYTNFSKTQQQLSIRGISSGGEGAAADSSSLTLIDGVVISRAFAHSANMFDVSRVEVLRGPQGTLYGKNAVGGLVHIITNKPTEETEGYLEVNLGNYDAYSIEGAISGSLSDSVQGRLSIHADERDGYTEDRNTGKELDNVENYSARVQLAFNPSDTLSVLLRADYSRDNDDAVPRKPVNPREPYDSPFTSYTDGSSDPWDVENSDRSFFMDRTIWGASAEIQWELANHTLTSITAYRDANNEAIVDNFGSPDAIVWSFEDNDSDQFSQELRLDNTKNADKLRWQVGVYLIQEDIERNDGRIIFAEDPGFRTDQASIQEVETLSWGVFGQGTYSLSDDTDLTVGLRYSNDDKDFELFHAAVGPFAGLLLDEVPVIADTDESWDAITGVITLDHRLNEDTMVYATASQGYKAGGFNGEASTNEAASIPYDEENVINYELGLKAELLNKRLRVNAALFTMDYEDIQVETFRAGSANVFIDNAGEASIDGLELELTALLSENFSLFASYAVMDATYDKFDSTGDDFSGNRMANSPEWTATLAAVYERALSDGSVIRIRADYRGRSDIADSPDEDDEDQYRNSVDIFGLRMAWISSDQNWEVAAWGRNLTDKEEILQISPAAFMTQPVGVRGAPRTYGLSVKRSF